MKINILQKGILILISICIFDAFGQNCGKQTLCKPDKNDGFDYSSQSRFASLTSGEKSRLYISAYANNSYKINVCSEQVLGNVSFKLYEKVREKKKVISELVKGEQPITIDPDGNRSYGEAPIIDTIYDVKVTVKEVEIYDSSKGGNVWTVEKVDRTKNLVIELNIPKTETAVSGCVNLLVGTKRPQKSTVGKLNVMKD
jgi:hypothetical protein